MRDIGISIEQAVSLLRVLLGKKKKKRSQLINSKQNLKNTLLILIPQTPIDRIHSLPVIEEMV